MDYARDIREFDPGIGGEKLWVKYQSYFGPEHSIGRDAFLGVLSTAGLMLRKRKRGCRTTDSNHGLPVYPDLVQNLLITRPAQVWVSDITYIHTDEGFCFLSLVTDAYTHQIVGWCMAPTLEACHTLDALKMAWQGLEGKQGESELIHHSDRGSQYASFLYTTYLKDRGIRISMTTCGNPKDNAVAERIKGILKTEFLNHYQLGDMGQVRDKVGKAIAFFNSERPHRSIDMITPNQAAQCKGELKKKWKCHKDKYRLPLETG